MQRFWNVGLLKQNMLLLYIIMSEHIKAYGKIDPVIFAEAQPSLRHNQ